MKYSTDKKMASCLRKEASPVSHDLDIIEEAFPVSYDLDIIRLLRSFVGRKLFPMGVEPSSE